MKFWFAEIFKFANSSPLELLEPGENSILLLLIPLMMPSPNLLKWGILLKVLPFTLLFGLAKWSTYVVELPGLPLWKFDVMTAALFSTTTFVIAFILSGTLIDYRTSEDRITQIVTALDSIQDTALLVATNHSDYSVKEVTQGLIRISEAILGWLNHHQPFEAIDQALTGLNPLLAQLEQFTSGPIISRVQGEQKQIRLMVAQMQFIRDNEFLAPASVLLRFFLIGAFVDLLFTTAEDHVESLIVASFLFTSFLYLVILIRDLDNPFQYDGKSCVDVDLTPLTKAIADLRTSLDDLEGLNEVLTDEHL